MSTKLPSKIIIGAVEYKVKFFPDTVKNQYGACVYAHQEIYLSKNMKYDVAKDTLLHEVLHAIWNEASVESAEPLIEEAVVRILSTWLLIVFRDNPDLVKFLTNGKSMWKYGPKSNPLKDATAKTRHYKEDNNE